MTDFFTQTLPLPTSRLVTEFQKNSPDFFKDFYLSGGTGLSLQLGHRQSDDLDFFCPTPFDSSLIERQLSKYGKLEQTELSQGTLNTYVEGVKLQFLEYPYPLLESTLDWDGMQLSSILDIGCTKLQTVSLRGGKKDFIDLYFLLQRFSLQELLIMTKRKYEAVDYSQPHILKSLLYFEDAEAQPMPRMLKEVSWETVKETITEAVKSFQIN